MCWDAVWLTIFKLFHPLTRARLAKAELQLAVATVFRRYENQELFETTRSDVDIKHDLFLPCADPKSKGVRVIFK